MSALKTAGMILFNSCNLLLVLLKSSRVELKVVTLGQWLKKEKADINESLTSAKSSSANSITAEPEADSDSDTDSNSESDDVPPDSHMDSDMAEATDPTGNPVPNSIAETDEEGFTEVTHPKNQSCLQVAMSKPAVNRPDMVFTHSHPHQNQ